eukprot:s628_g7.t1
MVSLITRAEMFSTQLRLEEDDEIVGMPRYNVVLADYEVELLLPSGRVRSVRHAGLNVPSGSRAVADPKRPGQLYLLENGSSTLWSYDCGSGRAESLTVGAEATRFRSSLGSRFVLCGRRLLVTGTPNQGAHSPWIFDLNAETWSRLPDAPCAILSSAVAVDDATIWVLGGWSKMQSCHGYLQRLSLNGRPSGWQVSSGFLPWRRPGACTPLADGRIVAALGWMECASATPVGSRDFKLLRRNGGAQRAETSASRLVAMQMEQGKLQVEELSTLPCSDSFESLGEIFQMGAGRFLVCIGRDHVQMFDMELGSWQTWPLPQELSRDDSNSWVKHCGSWAVAFENLPEPGAAGAADGALGDAW